MDGVMSVKKQDAPDFADAVTEVPDAGTSRKRKKYKKSRKSGKKCLHFLLFFAKIITCDM